LVCITESTFIAGSYQKESYRYPEIPTTMKTMGVNITTIADLRVLIIEIGSTIILMVVEAQGICLEIGFLAPWR